MSNFEAYCRMVRAVATHGMDPRLWRNWFDTVWSQLTDDEKERAPAIPFPAV